MTEYRHTDTRRADGMYVTWTREDLHDADASPEEYLFQDPDYAEEDQARLDAFRAGDWHMLGIRARADVMIVRSGVGTLHTLTSPGLWGIESDSGEDELAQVFEDEKATLRADIEALGTLRLIEEG